MVASVLSLETSLSRALSGDALIYSFHLGRLLETVIGRGSSCPSWLRPRLKIPKWRRRRSGDQPPSASRPAPLRAGSLARRAASARVARSAYTGVLPASPPTVDDPMVWPRLLSRGARHTGAVHARRVRIRTCHWKTTRPVPLSAPHAFLLGDVEAEAGDHVSQSSEKPLVAN